MSIETKPLYKISRWPAIKYVISVLMQGVDEKPRSLVEYGGPPAEGREQAKIYIVPSRFFGDQYGTCDSLPGLPLPEVEGVPLLFGHPRVERRGDCLIVYADIVASSYFLLTRYEEIVRRDVRDQHGRFAGCKSLPYRAGFIHRPLVDEYASLLRKWLRRVGVHVSDPLQEIQKIYLTHDIDIPWRWPGLISVLKATLRAAIRDPLRLCDPALCYAGVKRDPEDCFDWILAQDARLERWLSAERIEVIFFLLAGGRTLYDARYDVRSRRTRRLVKRLLAGGASIGLHASYESGINPASLQVEVETLREVTRLPITSNRHHYLACREPEDMRQLEQAGITDDFSFTYADVAGFRLGTSRPVRWFDPLESRLSNLTLHPLTVMDCTLDRHDYMNLNYEEARATCFSLFNQVKSHNGELVLLWHNTTLTEEKRRCGSYHLRLYHEILRWAQHEVGDCANRNADSRDAI